MIQYRRWNRFEKENNLDTSDNDGGVPLNAKEKAYELIKQKIVNCEYMPGDVLSENDIKSQIQVGRTPIWEALNKLENERLVKIFPKRGIFVTNVTVKDVSNIYGIRAVLEPYALELAAPAITQEMLAPYLAFYQRSSRLSEAADSSMDKQFHYMIYDCADNQYLNDILKRIYDQNTRIRILSTLKVNNRRRNTCLEHLRIIEALQAGNILKAKTQMKRHVMSGWKVALTITG